MPWPIPTPQAIASRAASVYEGALPGDPDARSANSALGASARVVGMSVYGADLQQAAQATELWPDTAVDNLDRLAGIKGLTRTPASAASWQANFAGASGTVVPAATGASAPNQLVYATSAAVTVGSGPTTATFVCLTPGSAGTLAAGTPLTLVSPIGGLSAQSMTVLSTGLTAGEDTETDDALRARLLLAWRSDAAAGNAGDWQGWCRAALPQVQYVSVQPRWSGIGNVGLFVAMSGPRAPTSAELATITAYVSDPGRQPVCAVPVVMAATLTPVEIMLHLAPDTAAIRAGVIAAVQSFFLQSASIGGSIPVNQLDAAISSVSGEWDAVRSAPTADVAGAVGVLPICDPATPVTFV
jgi:uncharacterized phage protein gp47/JayE